MSTDHSRLRRRVARHRRVAGGDEAEDRGHVHDRAAALGEHGSSRQLGEHHHGDQVDLDQLAQLAQVLLLERHDLGDAGVRHGDVEAPVARERVLDEPFQVAVVAHVAGLDGGAGLRRQALERLRVAPGGDHLGAGGAQDADEALSRGPARRP